MFKFIHAADVHLDSPLQGLSRYESAPVEAIRDACRRAFENLIDLAIEEHAAFILLAGDLYDGSWKDYSTGIFLSQQMGRLAKHDIKVFAVAGNHDAANKMTKSLDTPGNMKVFSAKKPEKVILDDLSVVIHGRSFPTQHVDENLVQEFSFAEKDMFNIGLLHTSLDGREGHALYAPCSADDLRSKGYQYWALGHIHQQEIISEDPWFVFSGCIQGRHIREEGAKGCLLVTVDDNTVTEVESYSLDVFRWHKCIINISGASEMREVHDLIRKAIEDSADFAQGRPLAMRVRFEGETSLSDSISAFPEHFEQQVRALAAESGEDLWIERIEIAVSGKRDLKNCLSDESAFGELLRDIIATPDNPEGINGLSEIISELRKKLPLEALAQNSALDLNDNDNTERIVAEAKKMLVGRLLSVGDEQ